MQCLEFLSSENERNDNICEIMSPIPTTESTQYLCMPMRSNYKCKSRVKRKRDMNNMAWMCYQLFFKSSLKKQRVFNIVHGWIDPLHIAILKSNKKTYIYFTCIALHRLFPGVAGFNSAPPPRDKLGRRGYYGNDQLGC